MEAINIKNVERLREHGLMQQAGLAHLKSAMKRNPLFMHMKIRTKNLLQSMKKHLSENRKHGITLIRRRVVQKDRKSLGNNCKTGINPPAPVETLINDSEESQKNKH